MGKQTVRDDIDVIQWQRHDVGAINGDVMPYVITSNLVPVHIITSEKLCNINKCI